MKVQTSPLKEWTLKVPCSKSKALCSGVKDFAFCPSNKRAPFVYKVDVTRLPDNVRRLQPWEYLEVANDCNADIVTQAVLQSVSSTVLVLQEQRIAATKSMAQGRTVWRKIFFQMKRQLDKIKQTHRWYNVPLLYLKSKYLRYCIDEIQLTHRRCFKYFGFSKADLMKDSGIHYLHPKARYLLSWTLKEELFERDVLNEDEYAGIGDPGLSLQRIARRC